MLPPPSMQATESLSSQEVADFTRGVDADYFLGEGDYATYIQTHLMPPLTGTHAHTGRAANAPLMSRAQVPRGRARGVPPTRQSFGWPELLTKSTGWQYTGEAYRIPIEPPVAGHKYVRAPDSPPEPARYIKGLLEMLASFEGMILRREALFGFHGIQVPPLPIAPVTAVAGPSAPPPPVGRERQVPVCGRGWAKSAQAESGPSEPILSEYDTETSETEEAMG
ncbi:uncharacterized protein LOC114323651 [Camellia sinensis]|uniref:uncharacterized protein LOC114323651 n=1 Tax=Camellia sinensis TaxID=4442 RepID=UPI001036E43C|nr:uncharacterized protein LOC114323651 [Camellia sinensis]